MDQIPDGWKGRPRYEVEEAVRIWACAFFGVAWVQPPLDRVNVGFARVGRRAQTRRLLPHRG